MSNVFPSECIFTTKSFLKFCIKIQTINFIDLKKTCLRKKNLMILVDCKVNIIQISTVSVLQKIMKR